jgi:hypothetical protein
LRKKGLKCPGLGDNDHNRFSSSRLARVFNLRDHALEQKKNVRKCAQGMRMRFKSGTVFRKISSMFQLNFGLKEISVYQRLEAQEAFRKIAAGAEGLPHGQCIALSI